MSHSVSNSDSLVSLDPIAAAIMKIPVPLEKTQMVRCANPWLKCAYWSYGEPPAYVWDVFSASSGIPYLACFRVLTWEQYRRKMPDSVDITQLLCDVEMPIASKLGRQVDAVTLRICDIGRKAQKRSAWNDRLLIGVTAPTSYRLMLISEQITEATDLSRAFFGILGTLCQVDQLRPGVTAVRERVGAIANISETPIS